MRNRPIYASALGGYGLCNAELARPAYAPHRILVHRLPCLFHASFRPRFAATPLRFTNPSPPSGWVEDFHFLAAGHAQHTLQPPFEAASLPVREVSALKQQGQFRWSSEEPPRKAAAAKIGCPPRCSHTSNPETCKHLPAPPYYWTLLNDCRREKFTHSNG